jgi:hypothetical protein
MWNRLWSDDKPDEGQASCGEVAPFLTALFDAEATPAEAAMARAHLLACQRCALLWLDWNQARNILQTEMAPAPPPGLLWRVLMACRLGFRGERASGEAWNGAAFTAAPEPVDMAARILARTTRASAPAYGAPRPLRRRFLAAPAMAAPALALFLMVLQWGQLPESLFHAGSAPGVVTTEMAPQALVPQTPVRHRIQLPRASAPTAAPAPFAGHAVAAAVKTPVDPAPAQLQQSKPAQSDQSSNSVHESAVRRAVGEERPAPAAAVAREVHAPAARTAHVQLVSARMVSLDRPLRRPMLLIESDTDHGARHLGSGLADHASSARFRLAMPVSLTTRNADAVAPAPAATMVAAAPQSSDGDDAVQNFADARSVVNDYRALYATDVSFDDAS